MGIYPNAASHARSGTDDMDFDPVCVDDCRTVVCRAQHRGSEGTGGASQLGGRECVPTGLLVYLGGVHTASDRSGQKVPPYGAEGCTSYSDPHNSGAPDCSFGIYHRILSEPCNPVVSLPHL